MFSALFSFLGGSVFRMIWGEMSSWLTARQDHKFEIDRLRLQAETDAAQHTRNLEAIRVQADLGVQVVRVKSEGDLALIDAASFGKGVEATTAKTGIWAVDFWNGIIRPALATECMLLWSLHMYRQNWVLDDAGWQLLGAALGIYLADRSLMKRGK